MPVETHASSDRIAMGTSRCRKIVHPFKRCQAPWVSPETTQPQQGGIESGKLATDDRKGTQRGGLAAVSIKYIEFMYNNGSVLGFERQPFVVLYDESLIPEKHAAKLAFPIVT